MTYVYATQDDMNIISLIVKILYLKYFRVMNNLIEYCSW